MNADVAEQENVHHHCPRNNHSASWQTPWCTWQTPNTKPYDTSLLQYQRSVKHNFAYFIYFMHMSIVSACMTLCQKIASDPTSDGREPPYGCWELNSGIFGWAASVLNHWDISPTSFSISSLCCNSTSFLWMGWMVLLKPNNVHLLSKQERN